MAGKRKLDAGLPEEPIETPDAEQPKSKLGGMWGGSAMNMLKQRIEDTHGSLHKGILAGTVVMELSPDQIEDEAGSDRVTYWEYLPEFQALMDNIKRRGQTQPIRVRPKDPNWVPSEDNPLETKDKFVIQSGRRRLKACEKLDRKVLALVTTVEGDQAIADLEERFHENTMRQNLNGFEELLSIGLLAEGMKELTQEEIAERLSISQGDVSLGIACLHWRDKLEAKVDIINTPKRKYRSIIPKLKRGEPLEPRRKAGPEIEHLDVKGLRMVTKRKGLKCDIEIRNTSIPDAHLDDFMLEVSNVVKKFEIKGPKKKG